MDVQQDYSFKLCSELITVNTQWEGENQNYIEFAS